MGKNSKKYPYYCLFLYFIVWILLAINPKDRLTWFLENLLPFIFVPLLIFTYNKFRLSNTSYTLIGIFMILHAIGAHYTYSEVPFFKSLFDIMQFKRDNYDRLVHFSFGLLMVFPIREIIIKTINTKGFFSYYMPITVLMSFSASYEIIEWVTAIIVSPENAIAWLGMQGDVFDAEKDMLMAAAGAIMTMFITNVYNKNF